MRRSQWRLARTMLASGAMIYGGLGFEFSDRVQAQTPTNAGAKVKDARAHEADAKAAVADMVKALDEATLARFIETYMPPESVREMRRRGGIKKFLADSARDPREAENAKMIFAQIRVAALKAQLGKVKFNEDFTLAQFELGADTDADAPAKFVEPAIKKIEVQGYGPDLAKAIEAAIAALEKNDLESFVTKMLPLGDLQLPDADARRKSLLARLQASPVMRDRMLADFKSIAGLTPKMTQSNRVAEFELPGLKAENIRADIPQPPTRTVKLELQSGHWRLKDNTSSARQSIAKQKTNLLPEVEPSSDGSLVLDRFGDQWRISPVTLQGLRGR